MPSKFLTLAALCLGATAVPTSSHKKPQQQCDTVERGYICDPSLTHNWGQYSPYFSVASESSISENTPPGCEVDFVSLINRHGSRFPTASKSTTYNATIAQIKKNVKSFTGKYAFLKDFVYNLSSDNLTVFGQQELVNAGEEFYNRYQALSERNIPFVRTDQEARVLMSAQNWTQGFHQSRSANPIDHHVADPYPYPIIQLSDDANYNNTLDTDTCNNFNNAWESNVGTNAQAILAAEFTPAIATRLNAHLPNANITTKQVRRSPTSRSKRGQN